MKGFVTLLSALAVAIFAGCSKPSTSTDSQPQDSSTGSSAPAPMPPPAPIVSTAPDKTPVVSTPPLKTYAPEGTLFALQRITITNDDGIFSVPGGTKLKIVRKNGDGFIVTDGRREFPVEAGQVTNEIQAATVAANAHQAELLSTSPRPAPSVSTAPPSSEAALQAELQKTRAAMDAMVTNAKARETRIRTLQSKSADLASDIADMNNKIRSSAVDTRDASLLNRNAVHVVDPGLMAGWKRRLANDLQEKASVDGEINQLQLMH